jgi:Uncharacterised protein family (UPF0158)
MAAIVSLRDVVEEISVQCEGVTAHLNPDTGEIVTVSDEELRLVEDAEAAAEAPEWQQENLRKAREVLESDRFLQLPTSIDIHAWAIMERFSQERSNPEECDELVRAVHGAGAFRRFKDAIRRLDIEEEWYRFQDAAIEAIAKEWLEAHGIAYR